MFSDRPRKKCEIGINVDLDKCEQIKTSDDGCMNYNDQNLDQDNAVHTQVRLFMIIMRFGVRG